MHRPLPNAPPPPPPIPPPPPTGRSKPVIGKSKRSGEKTTLTVTSVHDFNERSRPSQSMRNADEFAKISSSQEVNSDSWASFGNDFGRNGLDESSIEDDDKGRKKKNRVNRPLLEEKSSSTFGKVKNLFRKPNKNSKSKGSATKKKGVFSSEAGYGSESSYKSERSFTGIKTSNETLSDSGSNQARGVVDSISVTPKISSSDSLSFRGTSDTKSTMSSLQDSDYKRNTPQQMSSSLNLFPEANFSPPRFSTSPKKNSASRNETNNRLYNGGFGLTHSTAKFDDPPLVTNAEVNEYARSSTKPSYPTRNSQLDSQSYPDPDLKLNSARFYDSSDGDEDYGNDRFEKHKNSKAFDQYTPNPSSKGDKYGVLNETNLKSFQNYNDSNTPSTRDSNVLSMQPSGAFKESKNSEGELETPTWNAPTSGFFPEDFELSSKPSETPSKEITGNKKSSFFDDNFFPQSSQFKEQQNMAFPPEFDPFSQVDPLSDAFTPTALNKSRFDSSGNGDASAYDKDEINDTLTDEMEDAEDYEDEVPPHIPPVPHKEMNSSNHLEGSFNDMPKRHNISTPRVSNLHGVSVNATSNMSFSSMHEDTSDYENKKEYINSRTDLRGGQFSHVNETKSDASSSTMFDINLHLSTPRQEWQERFRNAYEQQQFVNPSNEDGFDTDESEGYSHQGRSTERRKATNTKSLHVSNLSIDSPTNSVDEDMQEIGHIRNRWQPKVDNMNDHISNAPKSEMNQTPQPPTLSEVMQAMGEGGNSHSFQRVNDKNAEGTTNNSSPEHDEIDDAGRYNDNDAEKKNEDSVEEDFEYRENFNTKRLTREAGNQRKIERTKLKQKLRRKGESNGEVPKYGVNYLNRDLVDDSIEEPLNDTAIPSRQEFKPQEKGVRRYDVRDHRVMERGRNPKEKGMAESDENDSSRSVHDVTKILSKRKENRNRVKSRTSQFLDNREGRISNEEEENARHVGTPNEGIVDTKRNVFKRSERKGSNRKDVSGMGDEEFVENDDASMNSTPSRTVARILNRKNDGIKRRNRDLNSKAEVIANSYKQANVTNVVEQKSREPKTPPPPPSGESSDDKKKLSSRRRLHVPFVDNETQERAGLRTRHNHLRGLSPSTSRDIASNSNLALKRGDCMESSKIAANTFFRKETNRLDGETKKHDEDDRQNTSSKKDIYKRIENILEDTSKNQALVKPSKNKKNEIRQKAAKGEGEKKNDLLLERHDDQKVKTSTLSPLLTSMKEKSTKKKVDAVSNQFQDDSHQKRHNKGRSAYRNESNIEYHHINDKPDLNASSKDEEIMSGSNSAGRTRASHLNPRVRESLDSAENKSSKIVHSQNEFPSRRSTKGRTFNRTGTVTGVDPAEDSPEYMDKSKHHKWKNQKMSESSMLTTKTPPEDKYGTNAISSQGVQTAEVKSPTQRSPYSLQSRTKRDLCESHPRELQSNLNSSIFNTPPKNKKHHRAFVPIGPDVFAHDTSFISRLHASAKAPSPKKPYESMPRVAYKSDLVSTIPTNHPDRMIHMAGMRLLSAAAVPIQTEIRRFLAENNARNRIWAIVIIQAWVRKWICTNYLFSCVEAAIHIQSCFRGWLTRDKIEDEHFCATEIQRIFRGYVCVLNFHDDIFDVILIQSIARRNIAIDRAMEKLLAVVTIQSNCRCYLEVLNWKTTKNAAILIQTTWRRFSANLSYQFDLVDIIIVQSIFRRWSAKKFYTGKRNRHRNKCALVIQTRWRSWYSSMLYLNTYSDILVVQSIVRCWKARRVCVNLRDTKMSIRIQTKWRSWYQSMIYLNTIADILIVQSIARRYFTIKNLRYNADVIMVQSVARRYLAIKCFHQERLNVSATIIQQTWRAYSQEMKFFLSLVHIIVVQSVVRRFIVRQKVLPLMTKYRGTVKMQALWRGYIFRKRTAAQVIQSRWRGYIYRKERTIFVAAYIIQSSWRNYIYTKDRTITVGTSKMQALWKGYIYRRNRRIASIIIQKYWRRNSAQFNFFSSLVQVIIVQSVVRRYFDRTVFLSKVYACIQMQSLWRGYIFRQRRTNAVVIVQNFWRAKSAEFKFFSSLVQIIIAQSIVRTHFARSSYLSMKRACVQIQARWRGYIFRSNRCNAAIVLQQYWRSYFQYSNYVLYQFERDSAIIIQRYWRGFLANSQYLVLHFEATRVQAIYRGYIVRQHISLCHDSVIEIQCQIRLFLARKAYHMERIRQVMLRSTVISIQARTAATKIQRLVRSVFLKREILAATEIQSCWRYYKSLSSFETKRYSAIVIQKSWRGFWGFTDFVIAREAVVMIQKNWRSYVNQRNTATTAAKNIQRYWRGFWVFTDFIIAREAAVIIQNNWRSYVNRTNRAFNAAVTIQKYWRGFWLYSHYIIVQFEVIRIQTAYRGYLCRANYLYMSECATVIQCAIRMFLARKALHMQRIYAILWQSTIASVQTDVCVKKIQRWVRNIQAKRLEKYSALVIERFFIMVKREVDKEIQRREKNLKKKRQKRRRKKKEADDKMLERVWLNTVNDDAKSVAEVSLAKSNHYYAESEISNANKYSSIKFSLPHQKQQKNGKQLSRSEGGARTIQKPLSQPEAPLPRVGKGGPTNDRIAAPKKINVTNEHVIKSISGMNNITFNTTPPTDAVAMQSDAVSVVSCLTSPSVFNPRLTSANISRMSRLSRKDMEDDYSLEEAWIDTEIKQDKVKKKREHIQQNQGSKVKSSKDQIGLKSMNKQNVSIDRKRMVPRSRLKKRDSVEKR